MNDEGSLGAIIDLTTGRPLAYKDNRYLLGVEGEYRENGGTWNPRLTAPDLAPAQRQFRHARLGRLSGAGAADRPLQPEHRRVRISLPQLADPRTSTPPTFGFARPGGTGPTFGSNPAAYALLSPTTIIPLCRRSTGRTSSYDRLGATATAQWKPSRPDRGHPRRRLFALPPGQHRQRHHSDRPQPQLPDRHRRRQPALPADRQCRGPGASQRQRHDQRQRPQRSHRLGQRHDRRRHRRPVPDLPGRVRRMRPEQRHAHPGHAQQLQSEQPRRLRLLQLVRLAGLHPQLRQSRRLRAADRPHQHQGARGPCQRSRPGRLSPARRRRLAQLGRRPVRRDRNSTRARSTSPRSSATGSAPKARSAIPARSSAGTGLLAEFNSLDRDNYVFDERGDSIMPVFNPGFDVGDPDPVDPGEGPVGDPLLQQPRSTTNSGSPGSTSPTRWTTV